MPSRTLAGITPSSPWDSNSYLPPPGMLPAHAWCRSDKFLRDLRQERRLNSCCSALTTRLLGRASLLPSSPFVSDTAHRLSPRGSLNVTHSFVPCIPAPQEHQAQAHSQSSVPAPGAGCRAYLPPVLRRAGLASTGSACLGILSRSLHLRLGQVTWPHEFLSQSSGFKHFFCIRALQFMCMC